MCENKQEEIANIVSKYVAMKLIGEVSDDVNGLGEHGADILSIIEDIVSTHQLTNFGFDKEIEEDIIIGDKKILKGATVIIFELGKKEQEECIGKN